MVYEQLLIGLIFANTCLIVTLVYDRLSCDTTEPEQIALVALLTLLILMEISMYMRLTLTRKAVMYRSTSEYVVSSAHQH